MLKRNKEGSVKTTPIEEKRRRASIKQSGVIINQKKSQAAANDIVTGAAQIKTISRQNIDQDSSVNSNSAQPLI